LVHHSASFILTPDQKHFPRDADGKSILDNVPHIDTWKAMEHLVELGLTKQIGLSNFTISMLERLRLNPEVKIKPYAVQVEYHISMQQGPLRQYLKENGIILQGYSPLGSGDWRKPEEPNVLEDPELVAVAKELDQPVGTVALKFLRQLHEGVVLLVKSVTPARIYSNLHLDGPGLSPEQLERLKARERFYRFVNPKRQWRHDVLGDGW